MKNLFAVVGSWSFKPNAEKGITVYRYDEETADMTGMVRYDPDLSAGQEFYDKNRRTLYVTDEVDNKPGQQGGGGFVRSYKVEEGTGKLTLTGETCVLMGNPAYVVMDPSGDYLLVACHTGRNFVTKPVHDAEGNWTSAVLYDDAGVTLVSVNEDGSVGKVCDVAIHTGLTKIAKQVHSHPHSIVGSPDGEVYFACDKGLDRIYSYRVNRQAGKLIPLAVTEMEYATAPRYGAFHPTLPVFYENNEDGNKVWAFRYDKFGGLEPISTVVIGEKDGGVNVMSSDIGVHPNGRYLYAAMRGLPAIALLNIGEDGSLTFAGSIDSKCSVRGFCISPDGRFLLAACDREGIVKVFSIAEDGALSDTGKSFPAPSASCIRVVEA